MNIKQQFHRLSQMVKEVGDNNNALQDWNGEETVDGLEDLESRLHDVGDMVRQAIHESIFLRGCLEESKDEREGPDERGSYLLSCTKGTAPCSEIGESLGVSAQKISTTARRLSIKPVGTVVWELADGTQTTGSTYNLDQWHRFRDALHPHCGRYAFTPPERLAKEEPVE